jgi:hypothetical protein
VYIAFFQRWLNLLDFFKNRWLSHLARAHRLRFQPGCFALRGCEAWLWRAERPNINRIWFLTYSWVHSWIARDFIWLGQRNLEPIKPSAVTSMLIAWPSHELDDNCGIGPLFKLVSRSLTSRGGTKICAPCAWQLPTSLQERGCWVYVC